jgi:hypothetical protein
MAGVLATSCRWVEEDPRVHEQGVYADSARQVRRDTRRTRDEDKYSSLVPILECVEALDRKKLRAHFGYENDSGEKLYVPISDHNQFRPGPKDREQPVHFKAGIHERVVSVTFDRSESVTWQLEDGEALADSDSPRCEHDSDSDSDEKSCEDPKRCGSDGSPKPVDGGAPKPPVEPDCDICDGPCDLGKHGDKRDAAPHVHDAGCGCDDDAGAAPSDGGIDAAVGDKVCPEQPQFAASCVGALRCGPYEGPLHAKCSSSCCGQVTSFSVPLPTIAECSDSRWTLSIDPEAATDACGEPRACSCSAGHD